MLLSFGGSSNDVSTEYDEMPSGMGLFSLARRGAEISSRDWEMSVPPEAFSGEGGAEMTIGVAGRRGTTVRFQAPEAIGGDGYRTAVDTLARAALAMPYATTIDGQAIRRHAPMDWLLDHEGNPLADQTRSAIIGDCSIVVARFEDGRKAAIKRSPHDAGNNDHWLRIDLDIFGQALTL